MMRLYSVHLVRLLLISWALLYSDSTLADSVLTDKKIPVRAVDSNLLESVFAPIRDADYQPMLSSQSFRFQADFILALVDHYRRQDQNLGRSAIPILIEPEVWFPTFRKYFCPQPARCPEYVDKSEAVGQHIFLEYRANAIFSPEQSNHLALEDVMAAVNVVYCWPNQAISKFEYRDQLSDPQMELITHRLVSYRLIKERDVLRRELINGFAGKPVSGWLKWLFIFFGHPQMKAYRSYQLDQDEQIIYVKTAINQISARIDQSGRTKELENKQQKNMAKRLQSAPMLNFMPINAQLSSCEFDIIREQHQ